MEFGLGVHLFVGPQINVSLQIKLESFFEGLLVVFSVMYSS